MSTTEADNKDISIKYLREHRIMDIIQQLTSSVLVDKPDEPKEFLVKQLELIRSARVFAFKNNIGQKPEPREIQPRVTLSRF